MPKTNIEEKVAFERIRGEVTRQSKVRNWNVPEGELDYVVSEAIKDAMEESRTLALKEAEEAANVFVGPSARTVNEFANEDDIFENASDLTVEKAIKAIRSLRTKE